MTDQIKLVLHTDAQDLMPQKAHEDDAGYDLYARQETWVPPREACLVPAGFYLELPKEFEAQIRPRSGLAFKQKLTVLNAPGTIDAGYRGEVSVILFNSGDADAQVSRGDRIAQMVIQRLPAVELVNVESLASSKRGEDGFGSTDKKRS